MGKLSETAARKDEMLVYTTGRMDEKLAYSWQNG
jgi:hypothetical protein